MMDTVVFQSEAEFADRAYASHSDNLAISQRMFLKYSMPRHWWDWREFSAHLLGNVAGKALLDYGCGMGEEAVYFAKLGAQTTAIDASLVGVEVTQERATHNGLADRVEAKVMDATNTNFPANRFDLVHGLGILHHVGLRAGLREVKRVLKPGGAAVFLEPMGNIPFLETCKHWLHSRLEGKLNLIKVTEHEENLTLRDILTCQSDFSCFQVYPYRLLYRARRLFCPKRCHTLLERFDYYLLKVAPFLKVFAGAVVIHLKK
jgi:2-polyprenyl-3-methyl-5-hydroxy-6-metoxy-1,4-benzoquinol methylase